MTDVSRHSMLNLWGDHLFTSISEIRALEAWSNQQSLRPLVHTIARFDERGQLSYEPSHDSQSGSCRTRIFWVPNTIGANANTLDVAKIVLDRVIQESHLTETFDFYTSSYAGVSQTGQEMSDSHSTQSTYCFSYHPKLAVSWHYDPLSGLTSAIVIATSMQLEKLNRIADCTWQPWGHSMAPAYLVACLLGAEVDEVHRDLKERIRQVEGQSKHHGFKSRPESAVLSGWGKLSAEMSGCETKLAATSRKLKVMEHLLEFIQQCCEHNRHGNNASGSSEAMNIALECSVANLQRFTKLRSVDNEYTLDRARVQRSAVSSRLKTMQYAG